MVHVSKRIKRVRTGRNITQRELAAKADISYVHIKQLEKGVVDNPSCWVMQKIADATEYEFGSVMKGVDFTPRKQRE